jgi:hypothetical protein
MIMRAAAAFTLLLAACTDDGWSEVKLAELYPRFPEFQVPSSAATGESITVSFNTAGSTCVTFERTDVELTTDGADIVPYNRIHHPGENTKCGHDLRVVPHAVTFAFETSGVKTIRVHTLDWAGDQPVEASFALQVE